MNPKYLYVCQDGQLVRADVIGGICEPIYFPAPVKSGAIVEAMMSDNPNLTIEQFQKRRPDDVLNIVAG